MKTLFFLTLLLFNAKGFAEENVVAGVVKIIGQGEVSFHNDQWEKATELTRFGSYQILKTGENSYMSILLKDNSIIEISESSSLAIQETERIELTLYAGRVRILSYKGEKVLKFDEHSYPVKSGESQWSLIQKGAKSKVVETHFLKDQKEFKELEKKNEAHRIVNYSIYPESVAKNEKALEKLYSSRFVAYPYSTSSNTVASYDYPASRGIASLEDDFLEIEMAESFLRPEEIRHDFPKSEKDIWVHDIIYDETVRFIEEQTIKIVYEKVQPLVDETCREVVWDIASKSLTKWGLRFAKTLSQRELPQVVEEAYRSRGDGKSILYNKESFRDAIVRTSLARISTRVKGAIATYGVRFAYKESKAANFRKVTSLVYEKVVKDVYKKIKPMTLEHIKGVVKKNRLVWDKNVDRLIEHVSQAMVKRLSQEAVETFSNQYSKKYAWNAVLEASESVKDDLANYYASLYSERAGDLLVKLLAREEARNISERDLESGRSLASDKRALYEELRN